ncbi:MAG: tryptophan synthase subunit alpha, partial [Patescibacteria group bacterium]
RALEAGMTPQRAINLIKKIRAIAIQQAKNDLPIGILTYANIVFRYGIQRFYRHLKAAGADSVLIADVPLEEIAPFAAAAKSTKLAQIFLASDYTTPRRLKQIERISGSKNLGYLYVVSTLGVTGTRGEVAKSTLTLLNRLKKQTKLPLVVGFGISKPAHLSSLKKLGAVSGAIVGSALVKTKTADLKMALMSLQHAC